MRASVLGTGSFGTALAQVISKNCEEIYLFGRNDQVISSINKKKVNHIYHPLIKLNENIKAYNIKQNIDLINESDIILFSVPSGSVRSVSNNLNESLENKLIISTAKGIEYPSLTYMSQIIKEETNAKKVFSLSGPNFADELIRNVLSGITLGIDQDKYKKQILNLLDSQKIWLDFSNDVKGVEFCGILKNIYAVAMGILDSFFQGHNEKYTLLTLCFKEMNYILNELGHSYLIDKFCAFGDFNLTANTDKSRNRTLGLMLGKNMALNIDSSITIESLKAINAIKCKTETLNVPIIDFVYLSMRKPEKINIYMEHFLKKAKNY